jgi:hypothetical protein
MNGTHESSTRTARQHGICDLVIEHLILENCELRDRIVDITTDNEALRETLHECLGMFHRSQVQLARYQSAVRVLTAADRKAA